MIRLTEALHIVHVRGFPGLVEPLEFGKRPKEWAGTRERKRQEKPSKRGTEEERG